MGSLGDFGTPRESQDDVFGYFGHAIAVHPDFSDLVLLDFAQTASALTKDSAGSESIDAVMGMIRSLVHPDDFEEFWAAAKANRQTVEDLIGLVSSLVEALSERPTQQPSGSSDGQQTTGPSSEGVSSSPVVARLERQGRPDLALMVVQAQEHRDSVSA